MPNTPAVTIETTVKAPIKAVWKLWNDPEHVKQWNNASEDWHTPSATSDLREGGKFSFRMEAKDQSVGFDFGGTYTKVAVHKELAYVMDDDRTVSITFDEQDGHTHIVETFEAESENSIEMQREGWQAILDNFKQYTESQAALEN